MVRIVSFSDDDWFKDRQIEADTNNLVAKLFANVKTQRVPNGINVINQDKILLHISYFDPIINLNDPEFLDSTVKLAAELEKKYGEFRVRKMYE